LGGNGQVNIEHTFLDFVKSVNRVKDDFVDREDAIDALACGFMCQTNVLLIGPPGTAKTLVVKRFAEELGFSRGQGYFQYLLTKFTEPSEILGVLDIQKFRDEHKYIIDTSERLPEANIVFLDEVFNASSAILNSLLMMINEKKLLIGNMCKDVKIISVFGASNHTPDDPFLRAFFDRFPIRVYVGGLDKDKYSQLLEKELKLDEQRQLVEFGRNGDGRDESERKNNITLFSRDTALDFARRIDKKINDVSKHFVNQNDKRYQGFIHMLKLIKVDNFISDRSLGVLVKMAVAHAMLRKNDLNPNPESEDVRFVLTKTWDTVEGRDDIERIFH
jgi:MoxR-like ATPase